MNEKLLNGFSEMKCEELMELEGGMPLIAAVLIVGGGLARLAAAGFVAGAVYEYVMG